MSVRLAFGVTTGPGLRCWLAAPGGAARPADDRTGPAGAPVVLGPHDAGPAELREAVRQLTLLVHGGTDVAAGAGVDLGGGFVSARLAGAHGDRRDAVLAALRHLGTREAHRAGDRASVLVSLFGLSATKRVGAAANTAIDEERWAALQLASAASDLLGPEQLEEVLGLRAPDGIDPFPRGTASTLAGHLAAVLTRYPRPRRLALIVSLWEHVCTRLRDRKRLAALPSTQVRSDRIDRLRVRFRDHFDEPILRQLHLEVDNDPPLATAARWRPPRWWAARELRRLVHDAIAATALLRFARTLSDEGLTAAAHRHYDELAAAATFLSGKERSAAARRKQGEYSHPARPGCYVADLLGPLRPGRTFTAKTEVYVRERAGMARNYGVVVFDQVATSLRNLEEQPLHNCWDTCKPWRVAGLDEWRRVAGYGRAPGSWEQPPLRDAHTDGPKETLAQRLAADPAAAEQPHDLLWYADLADALAPFHGRETAGVRHEQPNPWLTYHLTDTEPDRLRADSVPLAIAEVAQLVAFGVTPPPRCRGWAELADGVAAAAAATEASVAAFPVPAELAAMDGKPVPGTTLTVEVGRDPRQLAGWSAYMGNCIGQEWYAERAHRGECVLMALRDGDGRIVANLDIRRRTAGWQVYELLARFNNTLQPALEKPVRRWVTSLAPPRPPEPPPAVPVPPVRARGGSRSAPRLPVKLVGALTTEVERALARTAAARRAYATLARGLGDFEPEAAVIALKRLGQSRHAELLRTALGNGLAAATLWRATGVRPLATAVGALDPALREYDRLTTLTGGAPLPRTLSALVRRPEIAPAYAMDVVARAVRAAMGTLVGEDVLIRSVARRPSPELLCAVLIARTCGESTVDGEVRLVRPGSTTVPGFPATDLLDEDGPWQRALPAAAELGAPVESFGGRGLLVPAALLGKGGWTALWSRAHR
ncbi:hypothetical protein [Amycolatopsis suaedae]|uniref:DUF4132 domain-containing protein n=1 Tax=Amycolatopsis suaedae TaxID=2510978 RepID=A0A4Q7J3I6_9PSEU|nr:hypothetical protein [Amycolatopsis suaedae]RZQ61196.1 hypothetical protein EWH70_25305 [Amycolatopsis suaedae]